MLQIGHFEKPSRVVLAPMAGITDRPFRMATQRFFDRLPEGRGVHEPAPTCFALSEMVAGGDRLWQDVKTARRLRFHDDETPRWVQIAGSSASQLAETATRCQSLGADIIDINMGCPAKKVCRKAAGAALLRDEALVARIFRSVTAAVDVPVTVKIRTGWSAASKNACHIAQMAEAEGLAAVTIHGRTGEQRFSGVAEYETIAGVKSIAGIPVIANGDIDRPRRAKEVLDVTGVDGVMVGRAARGRPWLLRDVDRYLETGREPSAPSPDEICACMLEHFREIHAFYGDRTGVLVARKHAGWYVGEEHFRRRFNRLDTACEQLDAIERYWAGAALETKTA